MTAFGKLMLLATAFVAVFLQAALPGLRPWLGVQVDLLPGLMVYAALQTDLAGVVLLGVAGGLWLDSLSANPPGTTVLPLLSVGLLLHQRRELILRDQVFAQAVLGALAGALSPVLGLLVLLSLGEEPILGWGALWQLVVLAFSGGVLTPLWFWWFDRLQHALAYRRAPTTSFRPDRDIRRGRF